MARGSLTSAETIRERLKSFDRSYLDSLHKQSRYLMGDIDWASAAGTDATEGDDGYPVYSDKARSGRRVGQQRLILNNALLNASRFLSTEPDPSFPQVSPLKGDTRKALFLARYRGSGRADGAWGRQIEGAFLDGDNLGLGFLAFGPRRNPITGERYVDCQHVSATQVIYDPLEPSPTRSSWMAVVHHLGVDEAVARWGEERVRPHVRETFGDKGRLKTRYVRVTEYWDIGLGSGWDDAIPTYAVFVGPWDGKPVTRTRNAYGTVPVAHMEYVCAPGEKRPIGKIDLQLSTSEEITRIRRQIADIARRRHIDTIDTTQLHADDVESLDNGSDIPWVRLVAPDPQGRPAFVRNPAPEVSSTLLQYLQDLYRQYNSDSQTSELDRASMAATKRTATEIEALASGTQQNTVYTRRALLAFYVRIVEKFIAVARVADTDPISVDVRGIDFTLNDPEDPRTNVARLLEEPSEVRISPQSIEGTDTMREMALELQKLAHIAPTLPMMPPQATRLYLERLLRAVGENDPMEWLGDEGQGGSPAPMRMPPLGTPPLPPGAATAPPPPSGV